MHAIRIGTLQWGVGAFCAIIGALMFVAPHQFSGQTFLLLQPVLPLWGALFLLAGAGLIAAAALELRRPLRAAAHLGAGGVLLSLAYAFSTSGTWPGVSNYVILGLGVAAAPLLARRWRGRGGGADLFALALALSSVTTGLLMLGLPRLFGGPAFDIARPYLGWHGASLVLGGAAVLAAQLSGPAPRAALWAAHLLNGAALLAMFGTFAAPNRSWTAIVFYGGFGALLALLPWLGPRLQRIDPRSLQLRLALLFVVIAALPLIVTVALVTRREEQVAGQLALDLQQSLAIAIAQDVADYVGLHQAAVLGLAAQPGLLARGPAEQRAALQTLSQVYPDIFTFSTFDAQGRAIARSDDRALVSFSARPLYLKVRSSGRPAVDVLISPTLGRPTFAVGAPVLDAQGQLLGLVTGGVESARLLAQLSELRLGAGGRVYLVDEQGRAIVHPEAAVMERLADLSALPPVSALLGGDGAASGALSYSSPQGGVLASYARVPGIGWGVVIEQPRALALAAPRAGRDAAFGLLLLAVAGAAVAGALAARTLTSPLRQLGRAATGFAAGDASLPLPRSSLRELATLADTFASMRAQLAARTAEAEAAVRTRQEALALLDTLFDTAPVGLGFFDDQLRYARVNEALAEINGVPVAAHLGRSVPEVLPDMPDSVVEDLRSVLATRRPLVNREVAGITPARPGRWRYWLASFYPVGPAGGPAIGVGLVVTEITERKRREEQQRLLAEASRALAASLDEAEILDGLTRLAVPLLADWCVVDGYGEDGGLRTLAIAHGDRERLAQAWELVGRYALDPEAAFGTARVVRSGQPELVAEISDAQLAAAARDAEFFDRLRHLGMRSSIQVPLRVEGQVIGAVALISGQPGHFDELDLGLADELARRTAIAIAQARLYRATQAARRQAEAAVSIRDQFLTVASHELKTPLTSLLGNAQLLQRRAIREGHLGPRDMRTVQTIVRQSQRLERMVSMLLDFSRIQDGRLMIERRPLDLAALLSHIAEDIQPGLADHTLAIGIAEGPLAIAGDELRLEQVFQNLLQNAVKYSPAGGQIELRAAAQAGWAVVAVSDQGIGIPPEDLPRLSQRFFRAGNADTANISGLGIGLYVVSEIVAQHGGHLEISSQLGVGSTFTVRLPLAGERPT